MASYLKAAEGLIFNVVVNGTAAYCLSRNLTLDNPGYVRNVVMVDTVFRIGIVHLLNAIKLPSDKVGTWGHLIFPCLSFFTQPLSVHVVNKISERDPENYLRRPGPNYLLMMAYIFFGWKVNMIAKDVVYLCVPSLKKST